MRKYEGEPDYAAGEYDGFERRRTFHTAVTWLIIVNVAIYLLEVVTLAIQPRVFETLFVPLGLAPDEVFRHGHVWQLVTYAFLHDPASLLHVLFNMLFLYWFGREIESVWGVKRFLAFYLSAAAFAAMAFAIVHFLIGPTTWCIGASGAVMALMMVYALWWPDRRILFMFLFPMRMWTCVLITIGVEVVMLLQIRNRAANLAHLAGLLYGYLIVRVAPRLLRPVEPLPETSRPADISDERRLDRLLDKVHREGINSLTWRERRFLKKMSERR